MISNFQTLLRHRHLISFLVHTQRRASVFGMVLGRLWFVLLPITQVTIYYFLIVVIFRAHDRNGISPFVLIMTGVIHYGFIQNAVNAAGNSVLQRDKLLLQVKIEPIVFVAASQLNALKDFLVPLVVYAGFYAVVGPGLTWKAWWYPAILALVLVLTWSLSLLTATVSVYLRDTRNIIQVAFRILMYLSPVLYTVSFVPASYRSLYLCNPIGCLFALLQWSLLNTEQPPWDLIVLLLTFVGALFAAAQAAYMRLSPGFTKAL